MVGVCQSYTAVYISKTKIDAGIGYFEGSV